MAIDRVGFGATLFNFFYEYEKLMRHFCSETELYSGQPRILTSMSRAPGCTLSELSARIGVGLPSLSVSVRSLKKAGLVRDNGAGRNRALYLTEEGQKRAEEFHKIYDTFLSDFLDSLGPEREEALDAELKYMVQFVHDYRDNP